MKAAVDTNVLVRHLTGEPPRQAARATRALSDHEVFVSDVVFAECVYVLGSYYRSPPTRIAAGMRSLLALPSADVADRAMLDRALGLYEDVGALSFADAYVAAQAESREMPVLSFDAGFRRLDWLEQIEP